MIPMDSATFDVKISDPQSAAPNKVHSLEPFFTNKEGNMKVERKAKDFQDLLHDPKSVSVFA